MPDVAPPTSNAPAAALVDVDPNSPITDPCGCNQPHAVHQRGDAGFCRATLAALA